MSRFEDDAPEGEYVSTPQGIFTAAGIWFAATEEALRDYAGEVLEHVPLAVLLRRAEHWLQGPQTLALWLLPLLLLWVSWPWAALVTAVVYLGWRVVGPSFASRYGAAALGVMERPLVQGLYYVFILSVLAAQGRIGAVVAGLVGFVLLRWGLVSRAAYPLVRPLQRRLYALPVPDQVLRAFLVRAALHHGIDLPQVKRIERRLFERWGG